MAVKESRFTNDSTVFYLTGWGHSGDHWLSKALNAHPEIFVLNCYEPSRIKYFDDGCGRDYRPDILTMTAFLEDIGTDYKAIGECHAYRCPQMAPLRDKYGDTVPDANILRHPYTWLDFYIRHRVNNCRMPGDWSGSLEHEWLHTNHQLFDRLGLPRYEKKQVEIWSAYQGMWLLHNILVDVRCGSRMARIEDLTTDGAAFNDLVSHITRGQCSFSPELLEIIYDFAKLDYRGEETYVDPVAAWDSWPDWKRDAFATIVPDEVQQAYQSLGYELDTGRTPTFPVLDDLARENAAHRPIVFASMMKSGTWLMREIIGKMTGLAPLEAKTAETVEDYAKADMIEFRQGTFLSSHLEASPHVRSKIVSGQAKVVFLYRNVGDMLLSLYHHFLKDVDCSVGCPVGNDSFLQDMPEDDAITLMIAGFHVHPHHWSGAATYFRQMDSWMRFSEQWPVHFVSFENLVARKRHEIERLQQFLGTDLDDEQIDALVQATEFDSMKGRARQKGSDGHYRRGRSGEHLFRFSPLHFNLLETMMRQYDPSFEDRFNVSPYGEFYLTQNRVNEFHVLVSRLDSLRQRVGDLSVAIVGRSLLTNRLVAMNRSWFKPVALVNGEGKPRPMYDIPGVGVDRLQESGANCVIAFGCHTVFDEVRAKAAEMGAAFVFKNSPDAEVLDWLVE